MSTVKSAGRASGVGADGVTGLADGVGVGDAPTRPTWAAGRDALGPSGAGTTAIHRKTRRPGRTRWRTGRIAGRSLVLEGAPYQRLKDGFKQTEQETEDQQEDQVNEENARDDDADQETLGKALHVKPHDLDQQPGHQHGESGADPFWEF